MRAAIYAVLANFEMKHNEAYRTPALFVRYRIWWRHELAGSSLLLALIKALKLKLAQALLQSFKISSNQFRVRMINA